MLLAVNGIAESFVHDCGIVNCTRHARLCMPSEPAPTPMPAEPSERRLPLNVSE